jgi:hypothetical protein
MILAFLMSLTVKIVVFWDVTCGYVILVLMAVTMKIVVLLVVTCVQFIYIYYCEDLSACGADDLQIRQRHKGSSRYSTQPTLEKYRKFMYSLVLGGLGSSVGIATDYGLDGPEIEARWGCDFSHTSRPALGPTQPPVQWIPGFFLGVKRPGRGADHPPPSSAEVKKG